MSFQDKYKLLQQLGKGSQGVVFLGENLETHQQVAVKQVPCHSDKIYNEVLEEILLIRSFDHPNIIKYHDYYVNELRDDLLDETTKEIIIVMELCDKSLQTVIEEKMKKEIVFDKKVLESFIVQLCSIIFYLHERQIIHRDIKPENILIMTGSTTDELKWNLKLIDFGVASDGKQQQNKTERCKIVGTPLYQAPEVLSEDYDSKVDIYSFGVVVYQLLTLKSPEMTFKDLTNMKQQHKFVKLLLKGYDNFFVELVSMCISNNKEKRAAIKDIQIFMKNMSMLVKPGPVITKEKLKELLDEDDEEEALADMVSDAQLQKEFIKAIDAVGGTTPTTVIIDKKQSVNSMDSNSSSSNGGCNGTGSNNSSLNNINSPGGGTKKRFSLFNVFGKSASSKNVSNNKSKQKFSTNNN